MRQKINIIIFVLLSFPFLVWGQNCVTFDDIATGTKYGSGYNSPGDIVFTEDGITVAVVEFFWDATTTHFGNCEIVPAFSGFGNGNVMSVNNINLIFNFAALAPTALISLEFADYGGFENLEINGHYVFIDELSWNAP